MTTPQRDWRPRQHDKCWQLSSHDRAPPRVYVSINEPPSTLAGVTLHRVGKVLANSCQQQAKSSGFFLLHVPPTRPVLLIQDGHSTHVSIELVELARENGVYLLCLPSHSSHVLQPLDVGIYKFLKTFFFQSVSEIPYGKTWSSNNH